MTNYHLTPPVIFSSLTISQEVAERKAARKKVIDAKLDEKLEPITKRLETVEKSMATKADFKNMTTKTDMTSQKIWQVIFTRHGKRGMKQTNESQSLKIG